MVKITNPVFNDVMELIGEILEQDKKRKKKKITTYAASTYPKVSAQPARLPVVRAPLIAPAAPAAPAAPLPLEMPVRRRRGRPAGQPPTKRRTRAEMEMAALNKLANTIAKRQAAEAEELAAQELALKAAPKKKQTKAEAKAEAKELAAQELALKAAPKKKQTKAQAKAKAEQERVALERAEWEAFERAAQEQAEWEAFVSEGSPSKKAKAQARAAKTSAAKAAATPDAKAAATPDAKAAKTPASEAKESELIFGSGRLGRYLGRFN